MYISANVAERIKTVAKKAGKSVKEVLIQAELGPNTMSNMKTSMLKADSLAKIADCLDCSVDYLLGRTENAKAHKGEVYSQEYTELFEKYMRLDDADKIKITERIDTLLDDDKYKKIYSAPNEA